MHIVGMGGDYFLSASVDFTDFLVTPTTLGVHNISYSAILLLATLFNCDSYY
jgi:hypothetical protein